MNEQEMGLRPCVPDETKETAQTAAGRRLLAEARCWPDWHLGRRSIERRVREAVWQIETEAMDLGAEGVSR